MATHQKAISVTQFLDSIPVSFDVKGLFDEYEYTQDTLYKPLNDDKNSTSAIVAESAKSEPESDFIAETSESRRNNFLQRIALQQDCVDDL
ncbi:hypothetical protein PSN45_001812 [Yamadazyma tenuis]|uniref:uncharacterized protein n=1 Tax=Candida tenuis TaxID=2315449 RepID=UPI00279E632A|nr:hypothetical protein PSN45_001812 [Yamadazyma tenuis]